ncbi:unnamed protein product [Medioppia subpectinata]|uniref:Lysozyme n=1 Tax=Medioppia subpectinata TaxID=1979941 RepID=A0A7R9PVM6_9ACAR|nr:unnamed protein product [Medioppia subpectinata]CAG2102811.1 unnamed protein product [Medioppia subpectinata]
MGAKIITLIALALMNMSICTGRSINGAGLELLKVSEGFVADFYHDQIGLKTIGYGHACKWQGCDGIHPPISKAEGTKILMKDLVQFEKCVERLVPAGLNDNQFSACVDFAFNMGCGAFGGSDILKQLRANNRVGAADAFLKYDEAGGRRIEGLTVRRRKDRELFLA